MKKLFFSIMAVGAMLATSCSSKVSDTEAVNEGDAIKAKIETCTNPDSLKIYVQQAQEYAAKLAKEGDDSAAKSFIETVAPAVKAKDPSAYNLLEVIGQKADSTVSALAEKADSLKGNAADKAKETVENAKDAANQAVQEGKDKANATATQAVQEAKDKSKAAAANAIQSGADKLKNAIGSK